MAAGTKWLKYAENFIHMSLKYLKPSLQEVQFNLNSNDKN